MKKVLSFSIIAILLGVLPFMFSSFSNGTPEEALANAQKFYRDGLDSLSAAITTYKEAAKTFENSETSIEELKQAHLNTRMTFKEIELFLEFFDHEAVKRELNGAPLPSLEANVADVRVLEPQGLQVLDELVFSEDPYAEKEEIIRLVDLMETGYNIMKREQKVVKLTHRHVFESIRMELIRIMTLGVTGFDTPGSVNAIPEAATAIAAISEIYYPYNNLIRAKDMGTFALTDGHLYIGKEFFEKYPNFDDFDRFLFLQKVINPLYDLVYKAQVNLGVETIDEVSKVPQPINYSANSLFANDFLNKDYYTNFNISDKVFKKRAALGKLLFFDPILSEKNDLTCASCHKPELAFTDGQSKSLASGGNGTVKRNSPTLINSVYSAKYFYDLRETDLVRQVKHVLVDGKEFGITYKEMVDRLEQSDEYVKLFKDAFKDQEKYDLSVWSITNALATYVASLSSFNSPFDKYVHQDASLDPSVKRGFNLFMGKAACGTCHFAPTFNGSVPPLYKESESEVLGVPATADANNPVIDPDLGRYDNGLPSDRSDIYKNSFKTVTVRNADLTAPYMHNGVYETLSEVMDFYNKGGGTGMGIDVPNQTLPFSSLNLEEEEIEDLLSFMEALTDTTGMTAYPEKLPMFEGKPEWNERPIGGKDY